MPVCINQILFHVKLGLVEIYQLWLMLPMGIFPYQIIIHIWIPHLYIHCYGLKCGDYFIYRTAWDSVANVRRYGGYGVSITDAEGGKSIIVAVN